MEKQACHSWSLLAATAVISFISFVGGAYYEEVTTQKEFTRNLHKTLYDEWALKANKADQKFEAVFNLFANDGGYTTYELQNVLDDFNNGVKEYSRYIGELERYGETKQILAANKLKGWFDKVNRKFYSHYEQATAIQNKIETLLMIENTDGDQYRLVNDDIDARLESLVRYENEIYHTIGFYEIPIKDTLIKKTNNIFRVAISFSSLGVNEKEGSAGPVPDGNYYEVLGGKFPFFYAELRIKNHKRQIVDDELSNSQRSQRELHRKEIFEGDYITDKNGFIRNTVKTNFMNSVIERNEHIQRVLEERYREHDVE